MSSTVPPIISFELGVGEFRIVTTDAVYQIKVCRDLMEAAPAAADQTAPPPASQPQPQIQPGGQQAEFFKEISEELFGKIGNLARKLSVSVEDLPTQLDMPDLDQTDQQLESAKGQLEEIVEITEKASMTIMDTADEIQLDMNQLKSQLDILHSLDLMTAPTADGEAPAQGAGGAAPDFLAKLDGLKEFVAGLLAAPAASSAAPEAQEVQAPPAADEPAAPAAPQIITVTRFDVDVVFQTLYELCTNESVKDHIKTMRAAQATDFNAEAVADRLSELAPTVEEEDGFYNFPIPEVLKALYAATASEDYRTILKKMNQTAGGIFLDTVLPIEGEAVEVEVPAVQAPAAPPPPPPPAVEEPAAEASAEASAGALAGCGYDDLKTIETFIGELENLARQAPPAVVAALPAEAPAYTSILTRDRDAIITAVNTANSLIQKTGGHLTRILEALSFQDLSGQRIMKVVALIGDIQMQLISMLVSANTKIQAHQASGDEVVKSGQAEKMAQEEVDKALEKMSGGSSELKGPGAEARLDQSAVNDLLAQLGF